MHHPRARAWPPRRSLAASALMHGVVAIALARGAAPSARRLPPPQLVAVEVSVEPSQPVAPPTDVARAAGPTPPASTGAPRTASPRRPPRAAPSTQSRTSPTPSPTPSPPSPPPPAQAALRAAELLRAGRDLALRAASAAPGLVFGASPPRDRTLFAGTGGDPLAHARDALARDVRDGLRATMARDAPGVRAYLWGVRRRMNEAWRPTVARVPNLAETLAASFGVSSRQVEAMGRWWRERQEAMHAERDRGGAVDALESIGGTNGRGGEGLSRMPNDSLREAWRRNTRITRAEVRVEQDPNGRVLDVRVVRSSGSAPFDRAAQDAVRHGIDAEDPVPLPGGRRSLWSFTVVATRRLISANIGGAFDESRGWFEVQLPGSVSMRSRVFMERAEPLAAAD